MGDGGVQEGRGGSIGVQTLPGSGLQDCSTGDLGVREPPFFTSSGCFAGRPQEMGNAELG